MLLITSYTWCCWDFVRSKHKLQLDNFATHTESHWVNVVGCYAEDGIKYYDTSLGNGDVVTPGQTITVRFVLFLPFPSLQLSFLGFLSCVIGSWYAQTTEDIHCTWVEQHLQCWKIWSLSSFYKFQPLLFFLSISPLRFSQFYLSAC